jgi:predicted nucleic acid-binding protein
VWGLDSDWVAPRLLAYELMNVFAMLVRQGALPPEAAQAGLESGLSLVRLVDGVPESARVLVIAEKLRLSAYDACYLAMAEAVRAPLVTEDSHLLRVAPEVARSLASLCPAAPLY